MSKSPAETKIAIIEDDIAIVQMYRHKFENEGYNVDVAGDGQSGLQLVEQFQPDIILLDLMMPQMSGLDMMKELQARGTTAKVVVLTNMGGAATSDKVYALKADDYIVKSDLTPKQVLERVKKLLSE